MKRIILATVFFFSMAGVALAQRSPENNAGNKSPVSTAVKDNNKKPIKNAPRQTVGDTIPNNRKEYMQNGQLATYTGHQATPVNSDQYQSKKGRKKAAKKKDRIRQ
jgi:hypothetical protein